MVNFVEDVKRLLILWKKIQQKPQVEPTNRKKISRIFLGFEAPMKLQINQNGAMP